IAWRVPASVGGTTGRRKSGYFGDVTTGAGIVFGAQADHTQARRTMRADVRRRTSRILPRRGLELRNETSRNIGHNRHMTVTRLVFQHTRMPVEASDLLAVGGLVQVERQLQTSNVERKMRCNRIEELIQALPLQRREAERCRIGIAD